MNEFLLYFFAGMFGEELIRKLAARPFGLMYISLMLFLFFNIIFVALIMTLIIFSIFTDPAADQSLLHYLTSDIYDGLAIIMTEIVPWVEVFLLCVSFLLAISYRAHYLDKHPEAHDNSKPGSP